MMNLNWRTGASRDLTFFVFPRVSSLARSLIRSSFICFTLSPFHGDKCNYCVPLLFFLLGHTLSSSSRHGTHGPIVVFLSVSNSSCSQSVGCSDTLLHLACLASQATIPDIDFHRPMTTQTDDKLTPAAKTCMPVY